MLAPLRQQVASNLLSGSPFDSGSNLLLSCIVLLMVTFLALYPRRLHYRLSGKTEPNLRPTVLGHAVAMGAAYNAFKPTHVDASFESYVFRSHENGRPVATLIACVAYVAGAFAVPALITAFGISPFATVLLAPFALIFAGLSVNRLCVALPFLEGGIVSCDPAGLTIRRFGRERFASGWGTCTVDVIGVSGVQALVLFADQRTGSRMLCELGRHRLHDVLASQEGWRRSSEADSS